MCRAFFSPFCFCFAGDDTAPIPFSLTLPSQRAAEDELALNEAGWDR
jgi:hypothetical protein